MLLEVIRCQIVSIRAKKGVMDLGKINVTHSLSAFAAHMRCGHANVCNTTKRIEDEGNVLFLVNLQCLPLSRYLRMSIPHFTFSSRSFLFVFFFSKSYHSLFNLKIDQSPGTLPHTSVNHLVFSLQN